MRWTQEDFSHDSEDASCQEHLLLPYSMTKGHPKALAWKGEFSTLIVSLGCIASLAVFPSSDLKGLLELSNHCYANVTSLQQWQSDAMKMLYATTWGKKKPIYFWAKEIYLKHQNLGFKLAALPWIAKVLEPFLWHISRLETSRGWGQWSCLFIILCCIALYLSYLYSHPSIWDTLDGNTNK